MRRAREVLKLLTEKFPTLQGRRHCILLDTDPGSADVLSIGLSFGAEWLGIKLDSMADLDRDPVDLVAEISKLVEQKVQEQSNLRIAEALLAEADKKHRETLERNAQSGMRVALESEELDEDE